jgi:hypothetical protein
MRLLSDSKINDYQQQLLVHPEITYLGTTIVKGQPFNDYVVKSNWTRFQLLQDFDPRAPGINSFVWPWDVAFFVRDAGPYLGHIIAAPKLVRDFFAELHDKVPQEAARLIARNDLWREAFRLLGEHEEFNRLFPAAARVCRWIAGTERGEGSLTVDVPAEDPNWARIIGEVAYRLGIILTASGAALGLSVGIVGTAIAVGGASGGVLAPVAAIAAAVLLLLVHLGWALSVVLTILTLIVNGVLIFNP